MEELQQLAEKACEVAIALGADFADAYASAWHSIAVNVENNSIASCRSIEDQGVSIRAYRKGGLGFAYTQRLSEEALREVAERAVRLAGVAEPDPDFVSLPEPDTASEVPGLWDDRIAGLGAEEVTGWAMAAVEEGRAREPGITMSGGAAAAVSRHAIANSLGIRRQRATTSVYVSSHGSIREGDEVGSYWEYSQARRMADLRWEGIGEVAAEGARRFLKKRAVQTATLPVVLGPLAAASIPGAIASLANAESVQRNRSILAGKKGDKIASGVLSIEDEPLREGGMWSRAHDGEGKACAALTLVSEGVLAAYLHNSYTANKAKEPNNGRASRSGYITTVGISSTNLNMRRGDTTSVEIIRGTRRGIYMPYGSLYPNPVTGDVSETIDLGLMIEDGELTFAIKNSMLGGSFLSLLEGIEAVSSDFRSEPGVELPTVLIGSARIAGAA